MEVSEELDNRNKYALICILTIFIISILVLSYYHFFENKNESLIKFNDVSNVKQSKDINVIDTHQRTNILKTDDTKNKIKNTYQQNKDQEETNNEINQKIASNNTYSVDTPNRIDKEAGFSNKNKYSGKRINVALTGLDGRIGRISKLADANHVISILLNEGRIEIYSVPRDTYVSLGFEDSTGMNKLTICRSKKGRSRYLVELAKIVGVDKIHYWAEIGFSQAIGIIDFLGYKNPQNTLQVLRSRKGLGGDDYQRCYSQGQFIRQSILGHYNKFTGILGGVLVRAALLFIETNLTTDIVTDIIEKLENNNFSNNNSEKVKVFVRPTPKMDFQIHNFSNEEEINKLTKKIESFNKYRFDREIEAPQPKTNVAKKLNDVLQSAISDTAKYPTRAISKLSPYFEQRAWCQISDKKEQARIRNEFQIILYNCYMKKQQPNVADSISTIIEYEKKLFNE